MRMMMRWTVPVEKGNEAVAEGQMGETIEAVLADLKPEAAYFLVEGGERAGMVFFDMAESADIPVIAERLFIALDADVEFIPVMNWADLRKGLEKATSAGTA